MIFSCSTNCLELLNWLTTLFLVWGPECWRKGFSPQSCTFLSFHEACVLLAGHVLLPTSLSFLSSRLLLLVPWREGPCASGSQKCIFLMFLPLPRVVAKLSFMSVGGGVFCENFLSFPLTTLYLWFVCSAECWLEAGFLPFNQQRTAAALMREESGKHRLVFLALGGSLSGVLCCPVCSVLRELSDGGDISLQVPLVSGLLVNALTASPHSAFKYSLTFQSFSYLLLMQLLFLHISGKAKTSISLWIGFL